MLSIDETPIVKVPADLARIPVAELQERKLRLLIDRVWRQVRQNVKQPLHP